MVNTFGRCAPTSSLVGAGTAQYAVRAAVRCERIADYLQQARANKNSTGDLQKKLDAQKKQTREQTLKEIAKENNRRREADATKTARAHN